jgi:hypothetical protein
MKFKHEMPKRSAIWFSHHHNDTKITESNVRQEGKSKSHKSSIIWVSIPGICQDVRDKNEGVGSCYPLIAGAEKRRRRAGNSVLGQSETGVASTRSKIRKSSKKVKNREKEGEHVSDLSIPDHQRVTDSPAAVSVTA